MLPIALNQDFIYKICVNFAFKKTPKFPLSSRKKYQQFFNTNQFLKSK